MPLTDNDVTPEALFRASTAMVNIRRAAYTSFAPTPHPRMTADEWERHLAYMSLLTALETLWPEGECPPWLRQTEKES